MLIEYMLLEVECLPRSTVFRLWSDASRTHLLAEAYFRPPPSFVQPGEHYNVVTLEPVRSLRTNEGIVWTNCGDHSVGVTPNAKPCGFCSQMRTSFINRGGQTRCSECDLHSPPKQDERKWGP